MVRSHVEHSLGRAMKTGYGSPRSELAESPPAELMLAVRVGTDRALGTRDMTAISTWTVSGIPAEYA
jgi:hypothetical protein